MLLIANNPILALVFFGILLAAIIFSHSQRTRVILGGLGVTAVIVGLALFAEAVL